MDDVRSSMWFNDWRCGVQVNAKLSDGPCTSDVKMNQVNGSPSEFVPQYLRSTMARETTAQIKGQFKSQCNDQSKGRY